MKLHDDVHNYYEKLVLDEILVQGLDKTMDTDTLADFCCTVLNHLPPRYIRYEVDMAFYLPAEERIEMENKVKKAITKSTDLLSQRGQVGKK